MDGAALIRAFRQRADDAEGRALYEDEDILLWATEAEREASIRAKLLFDYSSSFLTVQVAQDQQWVQIDPRIDHIERMTLVVSGASHLISGTGIDYINGAPELSARPYLAARVGNVLRLWPTPRDACTLQITCYRLPLEPIESPADEPEIAEQHHEGLIPWMLFRAYSMKDSEKEDPSRAGAALAEFEAMFGVRHSANVRRKHAEKRRVTTRMI